MTVTEFAGADRHTMLKTRHRLRKFVLTTHIVASVGWFGAAAAFLALAVTGLSEAQGTQTAASTAMETIGRYVLVPLSLMSLVTGVIQGMGTKWGLFRHRWVTVKLGINAVASAALVLMIYVPALGAVQDAYPVLRATFVLLLLALATALSIYKPRGMTRFGRRRKRLAAGVTSG